MIIQQFQSEYYWLVILLAKLNDKTFLLSPLQKIRRNINPQYMTLAILLLQVVELPSSIGFYNKCIFKQLKGQEKRREKTMYQVVPKELFK